MAKKKAQVKAKVQEITEPTTLQAPPPEPKKVSGNRFVGTYLIKNPEADEVQIKQALDKANLTLNSGAISAWRRDVKWLLPELEKAGWKRPEK